MLRTYRELSRVIYVKYIITLSILTAVPCFRKGADSVSTRNIQDIHPSLVSNGTRHRDLQYSRPPKQVTKIGIAILSFSDNSYYVSITSLRTSIRLVYVCTCAIHKVIVLNCVCYTYYNKTNCLVVFTCNVVMSTCQKFEAALRLRLPVCLINYSWFTKYSAALGACIKWRSTWVHFSASIIERHRNPLTVHCTYSNSMYSEEGPEYQNFAMVLTVLELWPCTATGPQQDRHEI